MPFFTTKALHERHQRTRYPLGKSASIMLREAVDASGSFTFFLSHSFRDATIIGPLRDEIQELGFSVYVDWLEDTQLDRTKVNPQTAAFLRERMKRSQALLYASSPNASASRWMPWEAGYFDAAKDRVAIIPIFDEDPPTRHYKGQEYLGLYPYIIKGPDTNNKPRLWVHTDERTYVVMERWLSGTKPYRRNEP